MPLKVVRGWWIEISVCLALFIGLVLTGKLGDFLIAPIWAKVIISMLALGLILIDLSKRDLIEAAYRKWVGELLLFLMGFYIFMPFKGRGGFETIWDFVGAAVFCLAFTALLRSMPLQKLKATSWRIFLGASFAGIIAIMGYFLKDFFLLGAVIIAPVTWLLFRKNSTKVIKILDIVPFVKVSKPAEVEEEKTPVVTIKTPTPRRKALKS